MRFAMMLRFFGEKAAQIPRFALRRRFWESQLIRDKNWDHPLTSRCVLIKRETITVDVRVSHLNLKEKRKINIVMLIRIQ